VAPSAGRWEGVGNKLEVVEAAVGGEVFGTLKDDRDKVGVGE